ncbi:MAG: hypothetical protein ABFE13_11930 [Phycisphaerales bacterium]
MLFRGDRVIYTDAHAAWLRAAGLWPVKDWGRPFTGTVTEVNKAGALVEWDLGRPWPRRRKMDVAGRHLAENLEVVG